MPITPQRGMAEQMARELEEYIDQQRQGLIEFLQKIGEDVVALIRTPIDAGGYRRYKDQSGNLTSSVGYVIIVDGQVIFTSSFEQEKPTATQGPVEGRSYAHSLAAQYPQGITLLVVAGMNYAAYVETKALGGMTSGELEARKLVEKLIEDANKFSNRK